MLSVAAFLSEDSSDCQLAGADVTFEVARVVGGTHDWRVDKFDRESLEWFVPRLIPFTKNFALARQDCKWDGGLRKIWYKTSENL